MYQKRRYVLLLFSLSLALLSSLTLANLLAAGNKKQADFDVASPISRPYISSKQDAIVISPSLKYLPLIAKNWNPNSSPEPPTITSAAATTGTVGLPYLYDVEATGNPAPTYALTTKPAGMTIDKNSGLISWTPSSPGAFSVTVKANNIAGADSQNFSIYVLEPPLPPPTPVVGSPPIDFELVRTELISQGLDLSFNKIGFHTGFDNNTKYNTFLYGEWMVELDSAGVPFFLKTVDNAEPVYNAQLLAQASGISHTLVFRTSDGKGPGYDQPNYKLPPDEAAVGHWQYHKDAFPKELDPSLVWIETVNEVDKNRSEWLAQFALKTAQLALAEEDGSRWAAFGWSSGEPEPEHWTSPAMLEFLRLAADNPDRIAIALHEYSYEADDIGRAYPYLVGRLQALFNACDQHGIPRPTVLITEWGWTLNDIPPKSQAMDDIRWASWLYAAYPQVKGAAIWYLGEGSQFPDIDDEVAALIEPMRDYSLSSYFEIVPGVGWIDASLFNPSP